MILELIEAAYVADETSLVLSGTQFQTLQDEIAASTSLSQYDLDELAAMRYKGRLALGVDYSQGA